LRSSIETSNLAGLAKQKSGTCCSPTYAVERQLPYLMNSCSRPKGDLQPFEKRTVERLNSPALRGFIAQRPVE